MSYTDSGDELDVPQSSRMTDDELRALLDAEKQAALAATQAARLSFDRQRAMRYYLGDMYDMISPDGRSRAISNDVADTVDGLMPDLMAIFCGSDDVVSFDPVGPEDVQAAQQETDYVNHVFMNQNPGFLVLYSFIKDALISKNGFVKVWTETESSIERMTYYDQTDDAFALIASNPELEVVAHTMKPSPIPGMMLHDVQVTYTREYKCHKVACIPPEEVGITRNCTSMQDCGYFYHETPVPISKLLDDGYDPDVVNNLPTWMNTSTGSGRGNLEALARDTVFESSQNLGQDGFNEGNRQVLVTEHYVRLNYEGDGKTRLYCVVTGYQNEILTRDGQPEIREIDAIPIASITPVIQPHRFFGRSVADIVMDIQQVKTALLRAMLDNMYMSVNPRPVVYEANSGPQTLDDLLVMRPGMPIRAKTPGAIEWQEVPNVAGNVLPVMQFMDSLREWRTGVSRQGQGVDPNALQNQVATIANQMETQSQEKVKMIARIFAETGIKDLFLLLHKEIRKYGDAAQTVRLRNQWVTVDPTQWRERDDMTVNVGLGIGSKAQQLAQLQLLKESQAQVQGFGLVSQRNLHNTAKKLVNLIGEKDVDSYFVQPGTPPNPQDPASAPLPPPPDPNAQKAQADMAATAQKAQLEQLKSQADVQREAAQAQSEIEIAREKAALQTQQMLLDFELKKQQHAMDMEKHQAVMQLHGIKLQMAAQQGNGEDKAAEAAPDIGHQIGAHLAEAMAHHTQALAGALAETQKPKRIKKMPNGEFITEPVQ